MADQVKPRPALGAEAAAALAARQAREAEALRENLRRRKQQSRARTSEPGEAPPPAATAKEPGSQA